MARRANYDAVNRTLAALGELGRLEPVDAGLVALARASARAVDAAEPGSAPFAACARVHAQVLDRLAALSVVNDDSIGRLLDRLAVPATLGDPAES
jgi:hypothetical protein